MRKLMLLMGVLLFAITTLLAQQRTIIGKITDANGNPVPNASLLVKGSTTGTSTKPDGTYSLTINSQATISGRDRDLVADENTIAKQLAVYPNPVKDMLNIRWDNKYTGKATITVLDIEGKKIKTIDIDKPVPDFNSRMDVYDLKPGIYYLYISAGKEKVYSTQFLKK